MGRTRVWTQLRAVVPVRTGILALDDTGFPKQGTHSVGVQRQYCGALGKIGNCQVAVSSALIADGRTWPLTCDLYVPASWTDDPARRAAAGIPAPLRFREKWRIALAQVRTVLQAGFTITGVVVDADYGGNAAVPRRPGAPGPRVWRRDSRRGRVRRRWRARHAVRRGARAVGPGRRLGP